AFLIKEGTPGAARPGGGRGQEAGADRRPVDGTRLALFRPLSALKIPAAKRTSHGEHLDGSDRLRAGEHPRQGGDGGALARHRVQAAVRGEEGEGVPGEVQAGVRAQREGGAVELDREGVRVREGEVRGADG